MHTELISIPTDTLPLDGAYYTPTDPKPVGGVLLFHGNTMNFYVGAPRFLPPALVRLGYACLAFNRRGHDILSTRDSRSPEGGAFQTAAEGIADNEAAAKFLAERGFPEPVIIGHSNGGMLAGAYAAAHPEVRALVLLSAHAGGPATLHRSADAGHLAADDTDAAIARAEELVAQGRGNELMLLPGWWYVISALSLLDRLHNTPDLLEAARSIVCPSLFIRGDQESPDVYPAERFRDATPGPCDVRILPGCDHFYRGREDLVAQEVSEWLSSLPDPTRDLHRQ